MIILDCFGGLGNQMYHMALFEYLKQTYKDRSISLKFTTPIDRHTNVSYFDSIFKNWKYDVNNIIRYTDQLIEYNLNPMDLSKISDVPTLLWGYFQTYKYVTESFRNKLTFSNEIATKYTKIGNMVFIHIRGGDYLEERYSVHRIDLEIYYEEAIKHFDKTTQFCIFTNDLPYAKSFNFLNTIDHIFIEETPVDSLYLMSKCKGGICANSTFSWWGAYLNPNRKLILPSKWYNNSKMYTVDYYFPEATIVSVEKDTWPFIDKVVYINLDHRMDRNEHMKQVTQTFGDKVSRFSAIKTEYGAIGCSISHIQVLKMAIQNNWNNILILEDDVEWNNFEQGYAILNKLASNPYDVIMLGGSFVSYNSDTYKLYSAKTTTAYLVNKHYMRTLLSNFEEGLQKFISEPSKCELYAIDTYVHSMQHRDNWFIVQPPLVYQKPSYSDICNADVDYRSLMNINTSDKLPTIRFLKSFK